MKTHELLRSLLPEAEPIARHEIEAKASLLAWPLFKDLITTQEMIIEPLTPDDIRRRNGGTHTPAKNPSIYAESTTPTVSFPEVSIQLADGLRSIQADASLTDAPNEPTFTSVPKDSTLAHEEPAVFLRNRSSTLFQVEAVVEETEPAAGLPSFLEGYQSTVPQKVAELDRKEQLQTVFQRISRPPVPNKEQHNIASFLTSHSAQTKSRAPEQAKSLGETLMRLASQEMPHQSKKILTRTK